MNVPPNLRELDRLVEQGLQFLITEAGYVYQGFCEDDYQHLTWEWTFSNEGLNRRVRVMLFKNDPPRVAATWIDLIRDEPREWDDYTSTGQMHAVKTDLLAINGSLINKMSQHLAASAEQLRTSFANVVAGKEWKSDHLDWGVQK
jgi:hypothetical protein